MRIFDINFNANLKNSFVLLFTIFGSVLPIGNLLQLPVDVAFAQSDLPSIKEYIENEEENDFTSAASTSNSTLNNLFDSANDKKKENIMAFDAGTGLSSSEGSEVTAQSSKEVYGDFNGDGKDDLAIGVTFEDIGSIKDAGGVEVIYGSSSGLSATSAHADQFWTQDSANIDDIAETDDQFGSSLTAADFNGDGKDDLAIGVPSEGVGSISETGGVEVIYGSSNGLSATSAHADQFWTQDSTDIDDSAEFGDFFGSSLTAADFNDDGKDDLAIGVPSEGVGSISNTGGVEVIYGSSNGLSATSAHADQFWTQDSTDIDDSAETGDQFGSSLTAADFNADGKDDLAIGVRAEDVGSIKDAGGVEVIYGSSNGLSATSAHADQFWTQDSTDIDDSAETGDQFGSSLTAADFNADGRDDLAIGVPFEDVVIFAITAADAGIVNVLYSSSSGLSATSPRPDQLWTQNTADVNDVVETGDHFGFSLTSADFNDDGKDDLAIGVPDEDVGSIKDAGGVEVIYGSSSGLSATSPRADQFWTQDSTDIDEVAEHDNSFGFSLTSADFNDDGKDDLAIGVPFEDVGSALVAGGTEVIYGSSSGLSATSPRADQFWTQDSANIDDIAQTGDELGFSLG